MSPHVRAFGVGLVPGGQQVGVTYQPVTTPGETLPAGRTDGCRSETTALKAGGVQTWSSKAAIQPSFVSSKAENHFHRGRREPR